jgi:hypothetical protein
VGSQTRPYRRGYDHDSCFPSPDCSTAETEATIDWVELAQGIGSELRAEAAARDRDGEISADAFEILRASGLTSALVPGDFGGGGATYADLGRVLRTLSRYDPALGVTLSMHSHVLAAQVWRHHHGMDAETVFRKVVDDHALLISTGASDWIGSNGIAPRGDPAHHERVSRCRRRCGGCSPGERHRPHGTTRRSGARRDAQRTPNRG